MPDSGLPVIDGTVETTAAWLDEIAHRTGGGGRTRAYHVLRATFHALRDRLTADAAAELALELPLLLRGIYFEDWRPAETPIRDPSLAAWLVTLEGRLLAEDADAVPPRAAAEAVFALLRAEAGDRAVGALERCLPDDMAALLRAA
jgi:uncharacterized protein (DUF2267 family)